MAEHDLTHDILVRIQNTLTEMRQETRERLDHIEVRLSAIEQTQGTMLASLGTDRDEVRSLRRRIERIERRLELRDESTS